MKKIEDFFRVKWWLCMLLGGLIFIACDDDDPDPGPDPDPMLTGNSEEYSLFSVSDPGISGKVTFAERDDGVTVITIELNGTTDGANHPSHIHANTAAEGGGIVVDLVNVDGTTGSSETEVSALNDGTPISYAELIDFDGYVNVHLSDADLATLVAQGDIGQNELNGNSQEYALNSVSDPSISGTATFAERVNGETLITLDLVGTTAGGDHPSHIHANSAVEGGGISLDLANVDGESGRSLTNVSELNDGTAVSFEDLTTFNGYINVHLSSTDLATLIAQGDIGQNALNGNFEDYDLASVSDPSISGTATFAERNSGFTLITVQLTGTTTGGDHPMHIHANDVATGGGIAVSLTNVEGGSGLSRTHVTMLDDGTEVTYEDLIAFDGHINVHLSAADLATLIAQGNIGANSN